MSNAAALGAICYEAESAWGEDVTTFATQRLNVIGPVDLTAIVHDKIAPDRLVQYQNDGTQFITTTQGGTFKTKLYWTGHGSTMVGSPTVDAAETFMALAFGMAVNISATASTTLTGGTAAVPTTTASGTFDAGGLCRVGTLGDGRGNGQFYAITTHTTTSLTLRGALAGSPSNGDVLYPVFQIHGPENPTTTSVTSVRFLAQTANLQYELHGCFPQEIVLAGFNPGEVPTIEITWGVSWWRYSTATFPSAATQTGPFQPAAIAAGSLNVQVVGTTTRSTRSYRNLTLTHKLNVVPLMGPGGVSANQKIVGARRTPCQIELSWTEDADAATTSPVLPGFGTGTSFYHIEFTGSTADGSAFGFACPRVCFTNIPIQRADDTINRLTISARAYTSTVTTNDLTLAAIVYGSA